MVVAAMVRVTCDSGVAHVVCMSWVDDLRRNHLKIRKDS